ncbi:hypothetical protein A2803_01735 [Candidatus Woesebacteria bacterium RIFCSPHIGHO2_01_FULL_44_21]|uniref:LytR/CpsA/Psr regulator C-terminal domain-containing protein n=1 Tax=Candidatus Woesebacteria bacterium RIFCSPHIGHO2_01_FULL_44_21 TaxID=1802503 RepID=A0A1F7YVA4_9BACT|nr:MAG: hypothetical protein A2803_01735 [Candidatus Woesebacteria bacterium RIFCSPHIGHO2_01_FULL_44_21]OGM69594.1 MAG: hypothetical protein A2897_03250 [Candidatus Woesebacteria bacterium RIFCSPLOWO2_01_FULL_44_24b]
MRLGRPTLNILLSTQSLEVKTGEKSPKAVLALPPEAVHNQEVTNPKLLEKIVAEFIVKNRLKGKKGDLILSDDVVYQKIVPIADAKSEEYETQKFLDEVPFDNPNITLKKVKEDTNVHMYATNKLLFFAFKNIFEKYGIEIEKVSVSTKSPLNFLEEDKETEVGESPAKSTKVILAIFVFILVLVTGGLFLYVRFKPGETEPSPEPTTTPEVTAEPEPSPEAETEAVEELDLKSFSVQILNGTGVAGTAQTVSDLLVAFGFETVETGNAANYDYKDVTVMLKDGASQALVESIQEALGEGYKVTGSEELVDADGEFDVVVIVGKSE